MLKRKPCKNKRPTAIYFPNAPAGMRYVGKGSMVTGIGEAMKFYNPYTARRCLNQAAKNGFVWLLYVIRYCGRPEFVPVPDLRQPIEGSEHGPVRRVSIEEMGVGA